MVDIHDRFHGTTQSYCFNPSGRHIEAGKAEDLVFENERVRHGVTLSSRHEMRKFPGPHEDGMVAEWDLGFRPGAEDILVVVPRGRHLQRKDVLESIRKLLSEKSNKAVRILVSDPGLFGIIEKLPFDQMERLSAMWGTEKYTWEDQSSSAKQTLEKLANFKSGLPPDQQIKLKILVAHTLVPVGAVVRKEDGQERLVFLRLLPVGVDDMPRRELQLEERHQMGISRFYCDYLNELWERGRAPDGDIGVSPESGVVAIQK